MDQKTFSLMFAMLALLCWAAIIAIGIGALVRRKSPDAFASLRYDIGRLGLVFAWIIALTTTLGSLYYSKIVGYVPCELCWYQRICIYPLSVILGIAAFRRDVSIRIYAIPLLVVSSCFSIYHSWIQWFPAETPFCSVDVPCNTRYVYEFDFVSLPFMALSAAILMITLLLVAQNDKTGAIEADDTLASK